MFIGRKEELETLERIAKLNKAAIVVCRGRRRIGKSRLIQEFAKKFKNFYEFQGLAPRENISNKDQLTNFSNFMSQYFGLPQLNLNNWNEAFSLLAKLTEKNKALILLDEISWM